MSSFLRDGLRPTEVDEGNAVAMSVLCETFTNESAAWLQHVDEFNSETLFLAQSPDDAMRWMCRHSTRRALKHYIDQLYVERGADSDEDDDDDGGNERTADGDEQASRQRKRKRGQNGSGGINLRGVARENAILKYAETFANTQDELQDESPSITPEDSVYFRYMHKYNGIGWATVLNMIKRAKQVGSVHALDDFGKALNLWRQRKGEAKSVWGPATQVPIRPRYVGVQEDTEAGASDIRRNGVTQALCRMIEEDDISDESDSDEDNESRDEEEEDSEELQAASSELRTIYFSALRNEGRGVIDKYRHRWLMCLIYECSEDLRKKLKRKRVKTGRRGVRLSSVARDKIFGILYAESRRASDEETNTQANQFNRIMACGKRWHLLKRTFGLGIFVMVPAGVFPHNFVERTLSVERLNIWTGMVKKCKPDLIDMCSAVEGTVERLFADKDPASTEFRLENVVDWDEVDDSDLVSLLQIRPLTSQDL